MNGNDLTTLSAVQAVSLLRSGTLGAVEYIGALLRRTDACSGLHAMTHVDPEAALAAARHADATPASARGPLHGLPLVVKDNIDVAGQPCTAGSPALASHWPVRDADCVAPLRQAGALILGKANLHEFALGVTSANAHFGTVGNPHAPGRIAGGSSGGTAAAVAARLAPAGLGTDTGGSIRIPAAHCGVVGFRPSTGRWPTRGIVPISVPSRDTGAPMARNVADCALLDAVVTDGDGRLPPVDLRGLRLGLPRQFWSDLHAGLDARLQRTLQDLARAGVHCIALDLDVDLDAVGATGLTIAMAENLPALRAYFADHGRPFDPAALAASIASADVRAIVAGLAGSQGPSPQAYAAALAEVRGRLAGLWSRAFHAHRLDAMAAPTTPLPAARHGEADEVLMDGRRWATFPSYVRHCGPASLLGLPSLSLPAGTVDVEGDRLPVGLMLDGPSGTDRRLLAIGAALEALLPATPALP